MNLVSKILSRTLPVVAASSLLAVAGPAVSAHAACVPSMDAIPYAASYDGNLDPNSGQVDWTWTGETWAYASGCVGTQRVYIRITDRSIIPTQAIATTNWILVSTETNPDGGYYGYRGGARSLSVRYRDSFTDLMRGTLGQITTESKVEFTDSSGIKSSFCEGVTRTFTSTDLGPTFVGDQTFEPCTL